MRKARTSKASFRDNPLGYRRSRLEDKGEDNDALADDNMDAEESSNPLLEQLDSPDPKQRELACETLEQAITLTPDIIPQLLDNDLASRLHARIGDSQAGVREAACSALRNVCHFGGHSVCDFLFSEGLLEPLVALMCKMRVTVNIVDAEVRRVVYTTLSHVLACLHEMCQHVEEACSLVAPHASTVLLEYLDSQHYQWIPLELQCAAALLLSDLVDEDGQGTVVSSLLATPKAMSLLRNLQQSPDILLSALCSGVLLELEVATSGGGGDSGCFVKGAAAMMPALNLPLVNALFSLEQSAIAAGTEMEQAQPLMAAGGSSEGAQDGQEEGGKMDDGEEVDLPPAPPTVDGPAVTHFRGAVEQWSRAADAQQQALEVITNIFSGMSLSPQAVQEILRNIWGPILSIASYPIASVDAKFGEKLIMALPLLDGCVERLQQLQVSALSCLNNILIFLASSDRIPDGLAERIAAAWSSVIQVWLATAQSLDQIYRAGGGNTEGETDELLDASSRVLWSLARLVNERNLKAPSISPPQIEAMCGAVGMMFSREASVSLSGLLGCLAPLIVTSQPLLSRVTQTLLKVASQSSQTKSALLLAEPLSAIIDLYSDDSTHSTFVQLDVLSALKAAVPALKQCLHELKNNDEELAREESEADAERVEETLENVEAFIQYKRK